MATVDLETILFATPEGQQASLLEAFVNQEEPVVVAVEGTDQPVEVTALGRTLTVTPEGVMVTPRMAVELLYLYGKGGVYYGKDRETGHTGPSLWGAAHLSPEEKKEIKSRIQTWWLTCRSGVARG